MAKSKQSRPVYRVIFNNQGEVYELYARRVDQAAMYGFVEIGDLVFGERSSVLVDPAEERLKSEFGGVERTFIPMYAIVRIDQVDREGRSKITPQPDMKGKVTPFPAPVPAPRGDGGPSGSKLS